MVSYIPVPDPITPSWLTAVLREASVLDNGEVLTVTSQATGEEILKQYHAALHTHGVINYAWKDLITDYQAGLIYWLLVPLQDRYDGASKAYWWPTMQCLVAAFREWRCAELLGMTNY